jgi:hypothetical protein
MFRKTNAAAMAVLGLAVTAAAAAEAATACKDLPNPVYGIGGSASKPILGKVGGALTAAGAETIVYQAPGACLGINAILGGTKLTGTASYWDATGKEQTCDLPIAGEDAQFANMGNSATLCPGVTELPADVFDGLGPINTYTLIVPKASSQLSISSEAAYFVFGFGTAANVSPWTDETQIFRRDQNSAAQLFISVATGVPADKFKGVDTKSNSGTLTAVSGAASTAAEKAIGLISGEVADGARDKVRILAYKHAGQSCSYWPDSSETAFDKRSVRTGQYWIWSQLHFFTKLDADKTTPLFPAAKKVIGYFTGDVDPPASVNVTNLSIAAGTIPQCAMEVTRKGDLGPLESYAPAKPCGCYFDKIATGTTSCAACDSDAACSAGAPHCRYGYCEVN